MDFTGVCFVVHVNVSCAVVELIVEFLDCVSSSFEIGLLDLRLKRWMHKNSHFTLIHQFSIQKYADAIFVRLCVTSRWTRVWSNITQKTMIVRVEKITRRGVETDNRRKRSLQNLHFISRQNKDFRMASGKGMYKWAENHDKISHQLLALRHLAVLQYVIPWAKSLDPIFNLRYQPKNIFFRRRERTKDRLFGQSLSRFILDMILC